MDSEDEKKAPTVIRPRNLPEWRVDNKGRKRGLGGQWNKQRVAEWYEENPTWQTNDDVARAVYGSTSPNLRKSVRRHIPPQRQYMLYVRQQPIVTQYGKGGRIERTKLYNAADENDRLVLAVELERAREKNEMSQQRYEELQRVFLLSSPSIKQSA